MSKELTQCKCELDTYPRASVRHIGPAWLHFSSRPCESEVPRSALTSGGSVGWFQTRSHPGYGENMYTTQLEKVESRKSGASRRGGCRIGRDSKRMRIRGWGCDRNGILIQYMKEARAV